MMLNVPSYKELKLYQKCFYLIILMIKSYSDICSKGYALLIRMPLFVFIIFASIPDP